MYTTLQMARQTDRKLAHKDPLVVLTQQKKGKSNKLALFAIMSSSSTTTPNMIPFVVYPIIISFIDKFDLFDARILNHFLFMNKLFL